MPAEIKDYAAGFWQAQEVAADYADYVERLSVKQFQTLISRYPAVVEHCISLAENITVHGAITLLKMHCSIEKTLEAFEAHCPTKMELKYLQVVHSLLDLGDTETLNAMKDAALRQEVSR